MFWLCRLVFFAGLLCPNVSAFTADSPSFDEVITAVQDLTPQEIVREELRQLLDALYIERDEALREVEGRPSFFMPFCARALQGQEYDCLVLPQGEVVAARLATIRNTHDLEKGITIIVGRVHSFPDGRLIWNFSAIPYEDGWSRSRDDGSFVE